MSNQTRTRLELQFTSKITIFSVKFPFLKFHQKYFERPIAITIQQIYYELYVINYKMEI
jgi:hypothetical protein